MPNNIDINIDKTTFSCHIDLFNKEKNKNVAFSIYNTDLLTKDVKEEELINVYELEDKAVVEAVTYNNSLSLFVETENMNLVSEDLNKIAVYIDDEPICLITAIKVVDEENNILRSSIHAQEDGVELIIEEEVNKATVTIEFAPYLEFKSDNIAYLRSFGELDYWYDIPNREIYTVDAGKNKKLYIKLTASHIGTGSYAYIAPSMISETVFFSNYKKCFFKINGSTVTKIKDETKFFTLIHLYDDVYVTSFKNGNAYNFTLIEFTDIDTATYEVLDTHNINVGKSASEYCYSPFKSYDYGNKLRINFYSYQHNSYVPLTDQYMCVNIDKEAKRFDFTGIDPFTFLIYEDEEYKLVFKWADRKYYLNNKALIGSSYSYPIKPLTLINNGIIYCYSTSYNAGVTDFVTIDLKNGKILKSMSVLDKMWNNGCYAGRKAIDAKSISDSWDIFKDCDLNKRKVRNTTKDDFIITSQSASSTSVAVTDTNPLCIKREVVQNKKFLLGYGYTYFQSLQRDNVIAAGITVSENTNVEIKPFTLFNLYFENCYIIEEEKDYNVFTSITDVKRLVSNNKFNLPINEVATVLNASDDKYDLAFAHWGKYTETFEDDSAKLIKWINSTYTEEGLTRSNIRAYEGSYAGYMGRDTKGGSNVPDYYSEFETIGGKIEFNYYNSFTQYNQYLKVYVDNIEKFVDSYNSTTWKTASIDLTPNKKHIVKIFFEDSTVEPSNDKGFFIDNLTTNSPIPDKDATIYFDYFDLGMYSAPQGFNISFNGLETSSNITKAIYYSIDKGATWIEFNNLLPNVDGITLKAVFTKPNIEDEAYVRFDSVVVMPEEFEYIFYTNTSRKVYNLNDIATIPLKNYTIDMDSYDRYRLVFEDGDVLVESFGDKLIIPYEFTGNESYGEASVIEHKSASNGKCCRLLYNASFSSTDKDKSPGITFKVTSDKLIFKTKCILGNANQVFNVRVNNVSKMSFYPKVSDEFETKTIDLDPNIESTIHISYGTYVSGTYAVLIDDIQVGAVAPVNYSYIETKQVDLSFLPKEIKCDIETVGLQSSHELITEYFYSTNEEEWIRFEGSLPCTDNVRIKAVYTKDSIEDVVDATFESIVIKVEKIETGPTEIKVEISVSTNRVITSNRDNSIHLSRKVTKTAIKNIKTSRVISFNSTKSLKLDTLRKVVKANDSDMIIDSIRRTVKKIIVESNTIRLLSKLFDKNFKISRRVAADKFNSIKTERTVIKQAMTKMNTDTHRIVIKRYDNTTDLFRKIADYKTGIAKVTRKLVAFNIKTIDTTREVNVTLRIVKTYDTNRIVYKPGALYITQLNITYKLERGLLILESQEFN